MSVTGAVVVFICIFFLHCLLEEKRSWTRSGWDTTACAPTVAPATETELPRNPLCSKAGTVSVGFGVLPAWTKSAEHRSGSSRQRQKEKARGTIRNLEDDRCIDTGIFQRARVGVRLQPTPAAAPSDQPYHPDSSRLVCRWRSGSLRAGTPPSRHDRGGGISSVLIGARDEVRGL